MTKLLLAALLTLPLFSHAGTIDAKQHVLGIVAELHDVMQLKGNAVAVGMCNLANDALGLKVMGAEVLGNFAKGDVAKTDKEGIKDFMALVSSVIVSRFHDDLVKAGDWKYEPLNGGGNKGPDRVAVRMKVNGLDMNFVISKETADVVDVTMFGESLINQYKRDFQGRLRELAKTTDRPVTVLVSQLRESLTILCN